MMYRTLMLKLAEDDDFEIREVDVPLTDSLYLLKQGHGDIPSLPGLKCTATRLRYSGFVHFV